MLYQPNGRGISNEARGPKGRIDPRSMVIEMLDAEMPDAGLATLSQIREFIGAAAHVPFRVLDGRTERYALVQRRSTRLGWALQSAARRRRGRRFSARSWVQLTPFPRTADPC
jgi:hypothetical protein